MPTSDGKKNLMAKSQFPIFDKKEKVRAKDEKKELVDKPIRSNCIVNFVKFGKMKILGFEECIFSLCRESE